MAVHLQEEPSLVAQAQAGDSQAFTTLVNQYDRNIYRLALNITGKPEDAEEVLQDSFLKAYTNLGKFQGNSRFYTWLVRITVNEALTKLRQRRRDPLLTVDEPVETGDGTLMPREIEDWGDDPEQRYAKTELQRILAEAIEQLEPQSRSVFILRDVESFSTQETAEILSLSVPAVKSRLLRARLNMRERMNRYFKKG